MHIHTYLGFLICVVLSILTNGSIDSRSVVPIEPEEYILDFPTIDNPLNIEISPSIEKNYIIIIGDWGANGPGDTEGPNILIQKAVAQKLINFYRKQKEDGYHLLFVGTVGDNFYLYGQNCDFWESKWINIYGELATDYNWLALFGNHDWV